MDYPALIVKAGTAAVALAALVLTVIIIVKKRHLEYVNESLETACMISWALLAVIGITSIL